MRGAKERWGWDTSLRSAAVKNHIDVYKTSIILKFCHHNLTMCGGFTPSHKYNLRLFLSAVCCIISEAKWPSSSNIIGKHNGVSGPCNSAMVDVVAVYTCLVPLTFESNAVPRSRACQRE